MSRNGIATSRRDRERLTRRAVLAVPLLAGLASLGGCTRGGSDTGSIPKPNAAHTLVAWPAKDIWPQQLLEMPEGVQATYRAVAANHALLQYVPCYCGCYANGHTSVFDCYVAEQRPDGSIVLDTMGFG